MSYSVNQGQFIFDGVDSQDYGVYITGENAYNAAKKRDEEVVIPGRNGTLTYNDADVFDDVELVYPAFIPRNYTENIRGLRNALSSKHGKKRLTDSYHPDEYMLAKYVEGLEAETAPRAVAGAFDIIFKRDPRRFLLTGDEPVELGTWGQTETDTGDVASIDSDGTEAVKALSVAITPKQAGSGTPSPSNVRAISGYDSVNVYRAGKNLLENTLSTVTKQGLTYTVNSDGTVHVTGTATANSYIAIPINQTFAQSVILSGAPGITGTYIQTVTSDGNKSDTGAGVTVAAGVTLTEMRLRINNGTTVDTVFYPMIRLASDTDATYEPYSGETFENALPSTVYGGTLDVVSGALTVDRALIDLGSLTWNYASPRFYANAPADSVAISETGDTALICDSYQTFEVTTLGNMPDKSIFMNSSKMSASVKRFVIRDSAYTAAADLKAALNGVYAVYTLATPETYTLTPEQVELLTGVNNIWSDAGAVTVEHGQNPNVVDNPTLFAARPLIRVYGYGTLTVGDVTVTVAQNPYEYIDIDSEMMDCYHGDDNANSYVSFSTGEFPTLPAGTTALSYSGNITKVELTPHWWRL